jgi:hypothetical protein
MEISSSLSLIMMKNAGTITPVRWENLRSDDGGAQIRDVTNE